MAWQHWLGLPTYGKEGRELDARDHPTQLYFENASIKVAPIHTHVAGKHAFLFGLMVIYF